MAEAAVVGRPHDPEFRSVRREHLIQAGKRVRLKNNVDLLGEFFEKGLESYNFQFFVISASPQDVVQSALEGIVPPDHIFGTQLEYDASSGEIASINRVSAGYGKIAVLQELETKLQITPDHTIYMGEAVAPTAMSMTARSCGAATGSNAFRPMRHGKMPGTKALSVKVMTPEMIGVMSPSDNKIASVNGPYPE